MNGQADTERDVSIMRIAGVDYEGATRVYRQNYSETFHADINCPHLTEGFDGKIFLTEYPLSHILQSWLSPTKRCMTCTADTETLARIAVGIEGLPSILLKVRNEGEPMHVTTARVTSNGAVAVNERTEDW